MPLYSLDGVHPTFEDIATGWVADDAVVIGRVHIGRDVGIWFGATIRGDNELIEIGAGSNIQEQVVMHTDPGFALSIGAGCTIGHRAILHGCTIGENSLVGMGAIILNGAKIGRNCLVGAGALVTEGKVFDDDSLIVGSPARAIRTLDAATAERMKLSAAHYVANANRFRRGLNIIA